MRCARSTRGGALSWTPPGIDFGGGNFTITRVGRLVTVKGQHGTSEVTHSVTSPSHADCTTYNLDNVRLSEDGRQIRGIQFRKICLEEIILDKIIVSWTNPGSEGLRRVRIENARVYDEPPVLSGETTELADYIVTGNNNNNYNEIIFTNDMEGKTFTVNFVMGDRSAESYQFTPDDDD